MPGRKTKKDWAQSSRSPLRRRVLAFTLLVLCFVLAGLLRLYHFRSLAEFNRADDTALFTTEDALQFRYARMVAYGQPIPEVDLSLHHPDGFNVRKNLTTLVENIEGRAYRALGGGLPLHVFLVTAVCFVSSLGVFAAYGLAGTLWRSRRAGLFAACLYCVAVPTFTRIIGGYGTEHFALPLLFFGTWAVTAAVDLVDTGVASRRRARLTALAAGVCFATALAAWHLSRFLFTLVLGGLVVVWLVLEGTDSPEAPQVSKSIPFLLAPVLLASAMVPILQARPFWSSPMFLIAAAVPAAGWLGRSRAGKVRIGVFAGLAVVLALISRALPSGEAGYSHVWGIVAAKIANLGVKPGDPARLPFEARVLWIEDVRSPSMGAFLLTYGLLPVLAVLGLVVRFRTQKERQRDPGVLLFGALLLGGVTAYLFFARMTGFCVFFFIVLASGVAMAPRHLLLVGVLCLLAETQRSVYYAEPAAWKNAVLSRFPLPPTVVSGTRDDVLELFAWVRRHTKPGEAFLTRMGMGPTLLTYADRPVVLQSKMENREIWPRLRGYLDSLYGPEEEFYAYCRRYDVKYVLYEADLALDASSDSERFSSNALRLRRDSAAYLCQFQPERLPRFRLAYQNSFYRVFEVLPEGASAPRPSLAYVPLYNLRAYGEQSGAYFQDQGTAPVLARLAEARDRYDAAKGLLPAHRPEDALLEAQKALELNPGMEGLRVTLALALTLTQQNSDVIPTLNEEVRYFPDSVPARYYLGLFLVKAGRIQEGLAQWQEGLVRDPNNSAILTARSRYTHRP